MSAPAESRARPAGSAPELMPHRYGPVPPATTKAAEYAWPTAATGVGQSGIVSPWEIVMARSLVSCPPILSITRTVKPNVPATAGVPVICPVPAFHDNTRGNNPAVVDQTHGA